MSAPVTGNVRLNAGFMDNEYELIPGVIDEDARYVFTHGHCHSLALAIHEETGWPIFGTAWLSGWDEEDDYPDHVLVQVPDGRLIDITGVNYEADADWVDPEDAYYAFGGAYRDPEVDAARAWVKPVLAQVGLA